MFAALCKATARTELNCIKLERFSSRVCNLCARKIRNLADLYRFVKAALGQEQDTQKTFQSQSA